MKGKPVIDEREAGMLTTTGAQGVGKTYQNQGYIADYITDNIKTKVRGRKCLIFDTNGEYTKEEFLKNGHTIDPKRLALKDVYAWCRSPIVECRRIDAKNASISEKIEGLQYLLRHFVDGMLVLEDINTYILSMTHMEEIVGRIVNLRHRATDVIISYQSLRPVEPRIFQNSRWFRMHYQADNVDDIKNKVPNPQLYKIAQILVNKRYFDGDERFFLLIHNLKNKIEGNFSQEEFKDACRKYLNLNKKLIKEEAEINEIEIPEAREVLTSQLYKMYYGNSNK